MCGATAPIAHDAHPECIVMVVVVVVVVVMVLVLVVLAVLVVVKAKACSALATDGEDSSVRCWRARTGRPSNPGASRNVDSGFLDAGNCNP